MKVETKIAAAKVMLATVRAPYLATAIYAMTDVYTCDVPIAAVDKYWRLYLNEEALKKWSTEEIAGLLMHEVMHLIKQHSDRAVSKGVIDPITAERWNIACDAEINCHLKKEGFTMNGGWDNYILPSNKRLTRPPLYEPMDDYLTAEQYYGSIPEPDTSDDDEPDEDTGQGSTDDDEGEEETETEAEAEAEAGDGEEEVEEDAPAGSGEGPEGEGEGEGGGEASDTPSQSNGGSGVTNIPEEFEQPAPPEGQAKDSDSDIPPGVEPGRKDQLLDQIAQDVLDAAKQRGTVAGGLEDWAGEIKKPKVDWKKELEAKVRRAVQHKRGYTDYTYSRVSRRQHGRDFITPATIAPDPTVMVVLDTSGSMGFWLPSGERIIDRALTEVEGICKHVGVDRLPVIACDSHAHDVQRVTKAEEIVTKGGGGTDMGVGIEAAEKEKPLPNICIVVTDGETDWPSAPPKSGMTVIAARFGMTEGQKGGWKQAPDWLQTIDVDREEL